MKWVLVAIIVASTALGQVLQAVAMRGHGEIRDFRPSALGRVAALLARNKFVLASFVAMGISFFAFMALLSIADMSFAVPASAGSYVLEIVLAKYFLQEHVSVGRWAGAGFVAFGVAMLSL